jgi:hypothetical protein
MPDLNLGNPGLLAEMRRQAALISQRPDDAAINDWIEAIYDWDDFGSDDWDDFE